MITTSRHPHRITRNLLKLGAMLTLAAGGSACESAPDSTAADEIRALWSAVRRSVEAVNAAHSVACAKHIRRHRSQQVPVK